MDQAALDELLSVLDIEPIEVNIFRGVSPNEKQQRVFGGQVAGQALVAATRTVDPEFQVHSLHSYFLRPGDPAIPILYEVDRTRDGRSFVTRRVTAIQHGHAIFHLSASFHVQEPGFEHQLPMPTGVPEPESLTSVRDLMVEWLNDIGGLGDLARTPQAIEIRPVFWLPPDDTSPRPSTQNVWFRANGVLPDDPILHAVLATYTSDMTVLDTALAPHGGSGTGNVFIASLDHAMWFHRPFRADDWILYSQDSPSASGARGLSRGSMFTRTGELVVSVVQEGLMRPITPE